MTIKTIRQPEWIKAETDHRLRIEKLLGSYLQRRERHEKDPIFDFMFEYYAFRPALLERWSPGPSAVLVGEKTHTFLNRKGFRKYGDGICADPEQIPQKRLDSFKWIMLLLKSVEKKKPFYGCYGMHEWAMVYKTDSRRHTKIPLRLKAAEIDSFVETQPILCTHFDAFRFFSKEARPLNRYRPEHDKRVQMDQAGCIHVTMDVYKWAYKLYPWIESELIADAFELALEARKIDMQASPYDLDKYGLPPIRVETQQGRELYRMKQRRLHEKSIPIRRNLVRAYELVLEICGSREENAAGERELNREKTVYQVSDS